MRGVDPTAFQKLDRLIHERGRLGIMSLLASVDSLTFKELRDLLDMTDGNLSVHMRTLEQHEYVSVRKDFVDRKPRTTYSLTDVGRRAFAEYITALEAIVHQSRPQEQPLGQGSGPGVRLPARTVLPRRRREATPAPE